MKQRISKALFWSTIIISALIWFAAPAAADSVPNPLVIGPIPVNVEPGDPSHDYTFFSPVEDLADYGYVQEEFFLEGSAISYDISGNEAEIISTENPYKTRIVVRRPISPKDFNGTVLLEWQNVTAGYDLDAHWGSWRHWVRRGFAWVGVSAQRVGIHREPYGLKAWSPIRYGDLDVTVGGTIMNDSLSYDIFSQAAQAVRSPVGIDPMGGLPVDLVLAIGASQSASRLVNYYNAIHPLHAVVDAFYLLVGGGGTRTDLDTKVFRILSETDVPWGVFSRRPDTDNYIGWEVAGTSHSGYSSRLYHLPIWERDGIIPTTIECNNTPFSRMPIGYVLNAAYDHLDRWVKEGITPPSAPYVEVVGWSIVRDSLGLALGGIRLPQIEVPTALNSGSNSGPGFCFLYGSYEAFDDETLDALYRNHGDYVSAFRHSVNENLKAGYIVTEDAQEMMGEAAHSNIGMK